MVEFKKLISVSSARLFFLNSAISTSFSCSSTNSNSPPSVEVPTWTFSSGTSWGGVRATTRALVDLEGDDTGDPPTVSSGSRSEVKGPPTVPSTGGSAAGSALGNPPGSRSGITGGGDRADTGRQDSGNKVSSAGGTCTTCGPSASTVVLARTTSKLFG